MTDTANFWASAAQEVADANRGLDPERADLLAILMRSRQFARYTARALTDEQARQRSTVSELSVGGVIKHLVGVETMWADFILNGPPPDRIPFEEMGPEDFEQWKDAFALLPGETLDGVLADYDRAAERTDEVIRTVADLNASHPLEEAPWFPPGERWSARRVVLHIISETTQHAGHADIIRESIDGAKTMG